MRRLFFPLLASIVLLFQCGSGGEVSSPSNTTAPQSSSDRLPKFGLPIQCEFGKDCFVLLYTDRDPTPGIVDFGCGQMTYNGHTGTDFAIPDLESMERGVPVVAAADGVVLRVRDGESDQKFNNTEADKQRIAGKDCGNGLVIDHGQGWQTQYCHLRQNSVVVKPGMEVKTGTVLGLVGESGQASFPHVHFEPKYQGKPVDPFLGPDAKLGCKVEAKSMWQQKNLSYIPTGLMNAGFTDREPTLELAEQGKLNHLNVSAKSSMLIFWARAYGIQTGDVETIKIIAPDSSIFNTSQRTVDKSRYIGFIYSGKRAQSFMAGTWRGEYKLVRGDKTIININRAMKVE